MSSRYLVCLGREIHLTEWGRPDAPVLITGMAWRGAAVTFDVLARQLCDCFRVICPDTVGRGLSQWAEDPAAEYHLAAYVALAERLLTNSASRNATGRHLDGRRHRPVWARHTPAGRIRRLVPNDIGPEIEAAAVVRIRQLCRCAAQLCHRDRAGGLLPRNYASFGVLSDAQWRQLTETSLRRLPGWPRDAALRPAYRPAVRATDRRLRALGRVGPIEVAGAVPARRRVLLSSTTAEVTCARGASGPRAITVPGCGHAPALNTPEQIGSTASWRRISAPLEIRLLGVERREALHQRRGPEGLADVEVSPAKPPRPPDG